MNRGDTRRVPVSSSRLPLGTAAPAVRAIHELGTPALQHRGTLPDAGLPRAYSPFRFTQERRQLTAAVVDDCNDAGGAGSLAYQAARAQYAQRAHAAQESCQATNRSVIVDFDSNISNCAVFAECASDNRALAQSEAYVGEMSLRLPDPMTSIRAHRLLFASIPSYEVAARLRDGGGNALVTDPVVANAAPPGCAEEQYALVITEQFTVDARNQVVTLLPEASIVLPQTLTAVVSLCELRPHAVAEVCGAQHAACPHYVVQTQCDHEYMPGLLFYLLLGGGQAMCKQRLVHEEEEQSCHSGHGGDELSSATEHRSENSGGGSSGCSSSDCGDSNSNRCDESERCCGADDDADDDDDSCDPLRPGAPTPCFEVLEILNSTRFLARLVGTVADAPPAFQAFVKRRCLRPQVRSHVFTGGCGSTGLPTASQVVPADFLWCDPHDVDYCAQYYTTLYCIDAKPLRVHGGDDDKACDEQQQQQQCNTCARREAKCGGAVAYIPPPTSPCELADYVECVVQQVRDFMIDEHEQSGGATALHPLVDVAGVAYEPQTDTYIVKRYSTGGFVRWRTLLDTRKYGDTAALNFPLRRRTMVATEANVDAKQRYLNGVFNGFHWFVVCAGVNDCFCVELHDRRRLRVCVPAGCYRPAAFAAALQCAMNAVVPRHAPYTFDVRYSLHPVRSLNRFVDEEVVRPKANKRPDTGFPPCRNEPYEVQAFAFTIENIARCAEPFSLLFENARAFAALVDFEPRLYADALRFVSRALAPLVCFERTPAACVNRCSIGGDCAPCARRRYTAFVDATCGFTTLTQVQPSTVVCSPVVEHERDDGDDDGDDDDSSHCCSDRTTSCGGSGGTSGSSGSGGSSGSSGSAYGDTAAKCTWLKCIVCDEEDVVAHNDGAPESSSSSLSTTTTTTSANTHTDDVAAATPLGEAPAGGQPDVCAPGKRIACLPFCAGDVVWFDATPPKRCRDAKDTRAPPRKCGECDRPKRPLVGAVVLCVRQDCFDPCVHYVAVNADVRVIGASSSSSPSPVRLTPSPVGFNLHLHPALPPLDSEQQTLSSNERLVSQKGAVARWLGFTRPFTRSGCRSYTSNASPQSIIDQRIILRIPELVTLGLSEQRENHYQQLSPFDSVLTENYNVLSLDLPRGAYRYDAASAGPTLGLGIGLVPPASVLAPQTSSQQPCTPTITFQLYRPDGTPYETGGFSLVASLEVVYC